MRAIALSATRTPPGISSSAATGRLRPQLEQAIAESGCAAAIHRPGFLQSDALPRWYAHAGAFVLPSLSEPWGLVVNEAAASSLPLLVSSRAGCAPTLVPEPRGTTGSQFDPFDIDAIAEKLAWMASLARKERSAQWVDERRRQSLTGAPTGSLRALLEASTSPKASKSPPRAVLAHQASKRDETMTRAQSLKIRTSPLRTAAQLWSIAARRRARGGWVHLCNGLDPVRDGGMVPSILGMTGALGRCVVQSRS